MSERTTFPARLFDGDNAQRHDVEAVFEPDALAIHRDGAVERWPYAELTVTGFDRALGRLRLRRMWGPGARLQIDDPKGFARKALRSRAPNAFPPRAGAMRVAGRAIAFGLLSAAFVATIFDSAPRAARALAAFVPPPVETRIGERVYAQIEESWHFGERCTGIQKGGSAADAALNELVARLAVHAPSPFEIRAEIRDAWQANAFALPGGRVVVTEALLAEMTGPEQLAGVLAHEIGHVAERHSLSALISQAGLAAVVASLAGGMSDAGGAVIMRGLTSLSYSRRAENEADRVAVETLAALNYNLDPLADLFIAFGTDFYRPLTPEERHREFMEAYADCRASPETAEAPACRVYFGLGQTYGVVQSDGPAVQAQRATADDGSDSLLSTHPNPFGRAAMVRAAAEAQSDPFTPVMTAEAWAALQSACVISDDSDAFRAPLEDLNDLDPVYAPFARAPG